MRFNMKNLTRSDVVELIRNGDDSHDNQIRVTDSGIVYLSEIVGADDIEGLRFRFDTFDAGNDYVGEGAAADDRFIDNVYNGLIKAWNSGRTGYIDDWNVF